MDGLADCWIGGWMLRLKFGLALSHVKSTESRLLEITGESESGNPKKDLNHFYSNVTDE